MNRIWWCPNCHRTYTEGQQRGQWPFRLCHYSDCNTLAEVGQIDWRLLASRDPGLPPVPEASMRYEVEQISLTRVWRAAV